MTRNTWRLAVQTRPGAIRKGDFYINIVQRASMKAISGSNGVSFPDRGTVVDSKSTNRRQQLERRAREVWPSSNSHDEVEAHFQNMPDHYWDRVSENELISDIAAVHAFLASLASLDNSQPHVAVVWQHLPDSRCTRVRVCTWDRRGLLSKISAALGALRLSIIRAEVYTRVDNVVLDIFDICNSEGRHLTDSSSLDSIAFLIEGALSDPPRFASVWTTQFHKMLPSRDTPAPLVTFDTHSSIRCTIVQVEAADRLGLLHDILAALEECSLNVEQAWINTADGIALDAFQVTDAAGRKVTDEEHLNRIRETVSRAIVATCQAD